MEFERIKVLKANNYYFEVGETVCFTLTDGTEWDGKLIQFNDSSMIVLVDGKEELYKYNNIKSIWK